MSDSTSRGGLYASLRGLLATALGLLQTRLELLALEAREEKARLIGLISYSIAAVLLLGFGLVFLAALITVLLWDSNRLLALGVFSALFLASGIFCLVAARRLAQQSSGLFAASLAELGKDRAAAGDSDSEP
jgi:uncharacterized membrane protein YqjE